MTSPRDQIFNAINIRRSQENSHAEIQAEAKRILSNLEVLRPDLSGTDPVKQFHQRINSGKIAASSARINKLNQLPQAIADYCQVNQLNREIVLQPIADLLNLNWSEFTLRSSSDSDQPLAVTLGLWGVAETGSIVIQSGTNSPVLLNFLPQHHVLVLFEKNILHYLEDYAVQSKPDFATKRLSCLITGASGTTDIEGVLVNGAHGPQKLHIVTIRTA